MKPMGLVTDHISSQPKLLKKNKQIKENQNYSKLKRIKE
jgi:hypothetical protein